MMNLQADCDEALSFFRSLLILLQHKLFVCVSIIFAAVHDDDAAHSSSTFTTFCFFNHRFCSFTPETVIIAGGGSGCFGFRAADNHLTWLAGPSREEESRSKSHANPANVTGRGNVQRLDKQGEIRDCCAHRQLLHSQVTAAGGEVDSVFTLLMLTLSLS